MLVSKHKLAMERIAALPAGSFLRTSTTINATFKRALVNAASAGYLVRVRRGLYYKGVSTRYGMTRPRVEELVREVLGEIGVGPSGYSAARALGLTTQVPTTYEVAVLSAVGPIEYVSQRVRSNHLRASLSGLEIAVLEVLRAPEVYVESGWNALVNSVAALTASGKIDLKRTFSAAAAEGHAAARANAARLVGELEGRNQ